MALRIKVYTRPTLRLSARQPPLMIKQSTSPPNIKLSIYRGPVLIRRQDGDFAPYEGEYNITPSQSEQVLLTANRSLTGNIVINPIPQNYGLITYNGFGLRVT